MNEDEIFAPLGYQDDPLIFNLEYDNLKALKPIIE